MIKYGLISKVDAGVIEKTIDAICIKFPGEAINTCQIGVFDGETDRGIYEYATSKKIKCNHTAIDNNRYGNVNLPFPECNLIIGNSTEVAYRIPNQSQHFIFIDGDHSFPGVVSDFFCYAPKVKTGGFIAFHDAGSHILPLTGYQDRGNKDDPDMYISVRKALNKVGLLSKTYLPYPDDVVYVNDPSNIWEVVFDTADETDPMGGITVFRKL
jgi:hypothetical protein